MPNSTGNPFPFDPFKDLGPGKTFDIFRDIATLQELRHACEFLRQHLAATSDSWVSCTRYGRPFIRALWASMKRIGDGDVPAWPESLNQDAYSALFKKLQNSQEPDRIYFEARRRMLDAIAVVELWGEERNHDEGNNPSNTPLTVLENSDNADAMRKALRALYALKAFDRESRKRISDIAKQAERKEYPNAGPYRIAIPELVDKGWAATREGRGGGAWLTPDGHELAKSLTRKR